MRSLVKVEFRTSNSFKGVQFLLLLESVFYFDVSGAYRPIPLLNNFKIYERFNYPGKNY